MLELLNGNRKETQVIIGDEVFYINPSNQEAGQSVILDLSVKNVPVKNNGVIISNDGPRTDVKSLYFSNGAINFLQMPWNQLPNITSGDFTLEYWSKVERRTGLAAILAQWAQLVNRGSFLLTTNSDGGESFYFGPKNESTPAINNLPSVASSWNHTAITRKENLFTFWRNGNPIQTMVFDQTRIQNQTDWTIGVYMGRNGLPPQDNAARFNGWLTKIRIYSRCKYTTPFTPD